MALALTEALEWLERSRDSKSPSLARTHAAVLLGVLDGQSERLSELEDALLYALGYDIAGWPGHLRPSEILERVDVDPVIRSARSA